VVVPQSSPAPPGRKHEWLNSAGLQLTANPTLCSLLWPKAGASGAAVPELPEMQALAERLDSAVAGSTLIGAQALQFSALKSFELAPESVVGQTVRSVGRRGKFLVIDLDEARILAHLSQGGRVDVEDPPKTTRPKGAVVRLTFSAGSPSVLIREFGTERKAGWWVLGPGEDGPLKRLGPEPSSAEFADLITTGADRRRLHTMLRNQATVAGLGRGHTDDILHRAGLSPFATLSSLTPTERQRLLAAVGCILKAALDLERQRRGGLPARLDNRFAIHGQAGTPCPKCGSDIRRVSYESYEVAYCPACQTKGHLLADRRMSKLLR